MNPKSPSTNPDPLSRLLTFAVVAVVGLGVFAGLAILAYIFKFHDGGWALDPAVWGQFGDYFGGLVNPAIGLVTVFLVLLSIAIQRKELQSSLEELRQSNKALATQNAAIAHQNFEQTFFAWLSSYRDLVSSITGKAVPNDVEKVIDSSVSGRDALQASWSSTLGSYALHVALSSNNIPLQQLEALKRHAFADESYRDRVTQIILNQWERSYAGNEHHLDSMFRTLYRLVRWIDEQPDMFFDLARKWHYVSIIRAQLSKIEMVFLFYNGFTDRGRKFAKYINKYAIFDNLDDSNDFAIRFMRQLGDSAFAAEAFSSDLAWEKLLT